MQNQGVAIYIALSMIIITSGCARFNFGAPGTIGMQRERAVIHDPFPSNDLGPPIVGGRPLGFDRPLNETKGLQVNPFAPGNRRGAFAGPFNGF